MSLVPHTFFPRKMFDTDTWLSPFAHGQTALDMFDPFDPLDMQMNNAINWLSRPNFLPQLFQQPPVQQKYRITVDCAGYAPSDIKTEIQGGDKLLVSGQQGSDTKSDKTGDHKYHSFKKTFQLPKDVAVDKLTSFMTPRGVLVIDLPYKFDDQGAHLWPEVVKDAQGKETGVSLNVQLPECIDPSKVHVTVKDRDVVVRASQKFETPCGYSKVHYYRRNTMPESTNMRDIKCTLDDKHKMLVTAPIITDQQAHALSIADHCRHSVPIQCVHHK
jgi:HSP20 family molecular chaperone IbpA